MKHVVVHGGGRMGHEVVQCLLSHPASPRITVVARRRPDWLGNDTWEQSLDAASGADLLIDFTLPGGTANAAEWCRASLTPMVSGTTGLEDGDKAAIAAAGEVVPVLWAPNLSKGVHLLKAAASRLAAALGDEAEVDILDVHHADKKDAPSGTAVALAEAIRARRSDKAGAVQCHSVREGDVVGNHDIRFRWGSEEITLSHRAMDRAIWAAGAVEAGQWLVGQGPGCYDMDDWLEVG